MRYRGITSSRLAAERRLTAATALYAKAIAADPSFTQAYYNLAITFQNSRQFDRDSQITSVELAKYLVGPLLVILDELPFEMAIR